MTTSELTRSPQINKLLGSIEAYTTGAYDDEALQADILETQGFIEALQFTFESQLKISAPTPALDKETPAIRAALEAVREKLVAVDGAAKAHHNDQLQATVPPLKKATGDMFASFDRLTVEEAKIPDLSRSPYLNQLMKVGYAVADGLMDAEVFRAMLGQMISHHIQAIGFMKAPEASSPERKAELQAAIEQHLAGLRVAEQFFESDDETVIRAGLEQANQAAEKLYELEEYFVSVESAARMKACMRCGAENDVQAHVCQKCQAVMPHMVEVQESTVDVHVEDQVRPAGHVMTEITQGLVNMVASIQSGERTIYELTDTLQMLEDRMKATWDQLNEVDPDKQSQSPEELEGMKWAQEMMTTGLQEMAEGLNGMRRAVSQVDAANLDVGLEAFLAGADRMAAVQQAALVMAQSMAATTGGGIAGRENSPY